MSLVPLADLPADARVWCFGASSPPNDGSEEVIRSELDGFLREWTAHRADLRAGFDWLHDRFLVIAVDESATGASGCSIDALTAHIRHLGMRIGTDLLDSSPVWYRTAAGEIRKASREDFRELAVNGSVNETTMVFDLTARRLAEIRSGSWEAEAGGTWHARLL